MSAPGRKPVRWISPTSGNAYAMKGHMSVSAKGFPDKQGSVSDVVAPKSEPQGIAVHIDPDIANATEELRQVLLKRL